MSNDQSTRRQKHLLLVVTAYPPIGGVGGIRAQGFAKYLPDHGWRVTVVMPASDPRRDGSSLLEVPYSPPGSLIRRSLGILDQDKVSERLRIAHGKRNRSVPRRIYDAARALFLFPDEHRTWIRPARQEITARSSELGDIDAVVSSSPGVSSHLIARRISRAYDIPWVADLRDLWSQNPYSPYGPLLRSLHAYLERHALQDASALTCISDGLRRSLSEHVTVPVHVIPNGYDPETLRSSDKVSVTRGGPLVISYTGLLYEGKRDPRALLYAVREMLDDGTIGPDDVRIQFYGPREQWLTASIQGTGLTEIVKQYGVLTRAAATAKQRESDALLLLTWDDPAEAGTCPAKLFEYIAARRPVVSVGYRHGAAAQVVEDTGIGRTYSSDDVDGVRRFLEELYQARLAGQELPVERGEADIEAFSQVEMARKMAQVLEEAAKSPRR